MDSLSKSTLSIKPHWKQIFREGMSNGVNVFCAVIKQIINKLSEYLILFKVNPGPNNNI